MLIVWSFNYMIHLHLSIYNSGKVNSIQLVEQCSGFIYIYRSTASLHSSNFKINFLYGEYLPILELCLFERNRSIDACADFFSL